MFHKILFCVFLIFPVISFAQHIKILVVAIHGIDVAQNEWQPTINYLQQTLPDYTFSLIPIEPIDLPRIKELIQQKEIDFIITQPAIYVDLELNFGVSRILTMVKVGGISQFGSTIITRADSNIKTIAHLKGKKISEVNLGTREHTIK